MPIYDKKCNSCGKEVIDVYEPMDSPISTCDCGGELHRAWLGKSACVIDDSIPGGVWIKHGLCNEDGTPRRYDSKTEIRAEEKRRGYSNIVTHETAQGTDKSPYTTRWI